VSEASPAQNGYYTSAQRVTVVGERLSYVVTEQLPSSDIKRKCRKAAVQLTSAMPLQRRGVFCRWRHLVSYSLHVASIRRMDSRECRPLTERRKTMRNWGIRNLNCVPPIRVRGVSSGKGPQYTNSTPSSESFQNLFVLSPRTNKNKLPCLSPRANYTDRVTSACQRS
jgi:hypothetical protein